jgi:aminoglycoside phosphotransferase family enzyme/predicted kinase
MSLPDSQAEAGAFLARLTGSVPVETHISAVYVGNKDAWKLKKAVRLPFLDFSTAADRRHFLEHEYTLNKPEAAGIYRRVLAINRARGGALDLRTASEAADPLDWVLQMAPIPHDDFLDRIAARRGLTPGLLDALGDCVARSHASRKPVNGWNSADALMCIAERCAQDCREAGLPAARTEDWQRRLREILSALKFWLQARAATGLVRRCHGDLHLGNLCLWQGVPVPFDALEFDEAMATIDVGYDLAFLLMDLDIRASRAAANRVMNRAMARSGDAGATRGLPAFMSLRAMVRAYVHAASGDASSATSYVTHALDYISQRPATVLAIGGLQGTGKSTLARRLAPELGRAPGAVILRSDELRKRAFGVHPEQHLPPAGYLATSSEVVRQLLVETTRVVAGGGQAVIADATFLDPSLREAMAAAARSAGCAFIGIWLHAPRAILEERIRRRQNDASDATVAVLAQSALTDPGPMDWIPVDTSDFETAAEHTRDIVRKDVLF